MRRSGAAPRRLLVVAILALAARAAALPITLRDSNGTRYNINTDVEPLVRSSNASGAVTDATFQKPVTVTSYFIGFTPFFGFTTVYTVQRHVDVPLRNAFAGFNGLLITGVNGAMLPRPFVFNPGEGLASEDCPQSGTNRQLNFQTETFAPVNLQVTRKVFVPNNAEFVRWLNVVTNTGSIPMPVSITLRGLLGSGNDTRITATSTGGSNLGATVEWFTTSQQVPKGSLSTEPKLGFVVQGAGAPAPASAVGINTTGVTAFTYTPTIEPGESAIVMTFVTVQGNNKQTRNTVENLVTLPSKALTCLTEAELMQVVNFAPITPPVTKKATIALNFRKATADKVTWNGTVTIGAGIALRGLPVTVDVGGAIQTFVLNKQGKANNGGGNRVTLQPKLKQGVTQAGNVKFSFQLKGDFKALMADYGLVDTTVQNAPVTVPVSVTAGAQSFATTRGFTYSAKQGKSGTAKSP